MSMLTSGGVVIINVVLSAAISAIIYYQLTFPCQCKDKKVSPVSKGATPSIDDFYSSVWCWGGNHTNRRCRFTNLCYRPDSKDFVFFHGDKSALHGIPGNRFNPALLDLSSVEDHNTQYFSYSEVPAHSAKFFNIELVEGPALVYNRFKPDNLMHVIHDDLLPTFFTIQEICGTTDIEHSVCARTLLIVFSDDSPACQYFDLYKMFSARAPILLSERRDTDSLLCFSDTYVGLSKYTIWYQYGFRKPQGPTNFDAELVSREVRKFVRFVRHRLGIDEGISPTCISCGEDVAVLLSRTDTRLIVNEQEVTVAIARVTKFKTVYVQRLEDNSIKDIISTISRAQLMVGMHGAMLILSMFLPSNAAVIELFPYAVNPAQYTPYKTLVMLPSLRLLYFAWRNMDPNKTRTHPDYPPELGGIDHLPHNERQRIVDSQQVAPHLCCDDPEWMYRIYQDTIVDIELFSTLLEKVMITKQAMEGKRDNGSSTPHRKLSPSEVRNLSCTRHKLTFRVEWRPPWNIAYLDGAKSVEYELWIQPKSAHDGGGDVEAFQIKDTHYEIHCGSADATYLVWVRCHVDRTAIGPFNVYPLYCT